MVNVQLILGAVSIDMNALKKGSLTNLMLRSPKYTNECLKYKDFSVIHSYSGGLSIVLT